ncbi:MAG: DUF479 domain-containing protein [Salinivirgaceae bacterium]|nr:DUF479 domain-containing protein [Salinivirgaceae bacterium]
MNILAHIHLSQEIDELMLGNFMGDFIKGNKFMNYPKEIKNGILLHRKIDEFTDKHDMHKLSRDRLRPKYGLYSGIVVDIFYDHFLAKNWLDYHDISLDIFSKRVYEYLLSNLHIFPSQLQQIVPVIAQSNWLELYGSIDGIERVLTGMAQRTSLPNHVSYAIEILHRYYNEMNKEFNIIFNDLIKLVTYNIILYKFANN